MSKCQNPFKDCENDIIHVSVYLDRKVYDLCEECWKEFSKMENWSLKKSGWWVSEEEENRMQELYDEGISMAEIARKLNRSKQTVYNHVRR